MANCWFTEDSLFQSVRIKHHNITSWHHTVNGSTFIKGKTRIDSSETIQNNLEGTDKEITWCLRGHNVSRCVFQLEMGPWLGLNVCIDRCHFTLLSSTVHHHWNFGGIQYRTVPAYFHSWVKVKELLYVNNRVAPEGVLFVFECLLLSKREGARVTLRCKPGDLAQPVEGQCAYGPFCLPHMETM